MSNKTKFGCCKLCGKETILTFEHVPPEKAFNSFTVKKFDSKESMKLMAGADGRKPWEMEGLRGKLQQKGSGDYYLCQQCNNNTGSWYMKDYVKFTNTMRNVLSEFNSDDKKSCSFRLEEVYPLRIFKGIMTMFCDINYGCMGDDSLRDFILDRESTDFDHEKYSVYLYLTKSTTRRIQGISAMHVANIGLLCLTEISSFPVGLILYIDKPKDYKPQGLLLNDFARAKYDEACAVDFIGLPLLEVNSHFPADFRTKQEIIDSFEQGRFEMEKLKEKDIIK